MKDHFTETTVLEAFKAWAADTDLAVIAVHTTDFLGPVIQVAVIDASGAPLFDGLFSTTSPITPKAHEANGLTAADLEGQPALADRWGELAEAVRGRTLVAYASDFAFDALERTLPDVKGFEHFLPDHAPASVMAAFAFIAGRPSRRADKPGFSYVKLEEAYAMAGRGRWAGLNDLGKDAHSNALRVLRIITATAQRTPESLPHLLPPVELEAAPAPQAEPEAQEDPEEEQQQPLTPGPGPSAEVYGHSLSAVYALIKAGVLKQPTGTRNVSLPDRNLEMPLEARYTPIDPSLDALCRAACEFWLQEQDTHMTLTQTVHWASGVPWYYAALWPLDSAAPPIQVDHQLAPGLALVNLLTLAGLPALDPDHVPF